MLSEHLYCISDTGCWVWQGKLTRGYAPYKRVYAKLCGPIPAGYDLHHLCRNTGCVNPDHLQLLTLSEHRTMHGVRGRCDRRGPLQPRHGSKMSVGQSETSSPQHWHEQEWRDLICPICHRTTYGPEGNTFCGWHVGTLGNVLMESLLIAKGPER